APGAAGKGTNTNGGNAFDVGAIATGAVLPWALRTASGGGGGGGGTTGTPREGGRGGDITSFGSIGTKATLVAGGTAGASAGPLNGGNGNPGLTIGIGGDLIFGTGGGGGAYNSPNPGNG